MIMVRVRRDELKVETDAGRFSGWVEEGNVMAECEDAVDGIELVRDENGVESHYIWETVWVFVSPTRLREGNLGGTISAGTSHPQPTQHQKQEE